MSSPPDSLPVLEPPAPQARWPRGVGVAHHRRTRHDIAGFRVAGPQT
ncbi:hypothetical protein ACFY0F_19665 [Streptomyces sp. NPDC001544]